MNEKIKHLEFIQNIITRMNSNSFTIKGWTVTVVSALLALYANNANAIYIFIAVVPTFIFWFLDAFYLTQERRFKHLYDDVVYNRITPIFSMHPKDNTVCYFEVLWAPTLIWLYWPIMGALILSGLLLCNII